MSDKQVRSVIAEVDRSTNKQLEAIVMAQNGEGHEMDARGRILVAFVREKVWEDFQSTHSTTPAVGTYVRLEVEHDEFKSKDKTVALGGERVVLARSIEVVRSDVELGKPIG
ncbi:hypothetical protein ACLMJK_001371 [Lecanora helva]